VSAARWITAVATATALTLGIAACSADDTTSQPAGGCGSGTETTVNLLYPTQPVTLDGNYDTITAFAQISRNLYDGLFRLDNDMKVQPSLATGYTQPNNKTYLLTLRDGVLFHDGSKFTSRDVVSTFKRISSDDKLKSKQRSYVSNVQSVTAAGENKVQITLKQPDASFLKALASIIYITPAEAVQKAGDSAFGRKPVGSGPFELDSWREGDSVVLKANCNYWGDKPVPSRVEYRFISEPATQISSLQSGEIDLATGVTPDLAAALKNSSEVSVKSIAGNQTSWLTLNTLTGPFSDVRVRQALNYAIDKETITKQLLGGYAKPVGQPYAASVFGQSSGVAPYPYDPGRAKELLSEAGYGSGLHVELINDVEANNPVWQSIASYLKNVGIDVSTKFDPNFFSDVWLARKMSPNQIYMNYNNNLLMDADFPLGLHFDGARRGLYFHTPTTDAAIATARGLADEAQRRAAYDKLNVQLHELAPVVFLYSTDTIYGINKELQWTPRPDGAIYLAGATK
jgi:peptide/nickel transport system substrate-binding protein